MVLDFFDCPKQGKFENFFVSYLVLSVLSERVRVSDISRDLGKSKVLRSFVGLRQFDSRAIGRVPAANRTSRWAIAEKKFADFFSDLLLSPLRKSWRLFHGRPRANGSEIELFQSIFQRGRDRGDSSDGSGGQWRVSRLEELTGMIFASNMLESRLEIVEAKNRESLASRKN